MMEQAEIDKALARSEALFTHAGKLRERAIMGIYFGIGLLLSGMFLEQYWLTLTGNAVLYAGLAVFVGAIIYLQRATSVLKGLFKKRAQGRKKK